MLATHPRWGCCNQVCHA